MAVPNNKCRLRNCLKALEKPEPSLSAETRMRLATSGHLWPKWSERCHDPAHFPHLPWPSHTFQLFCDIVLPLPTHQKHFHLQITSLGFHVHRIPFSLIVLLFQTLSLLLHPCLSPFFIFPVSSLL